MKTFILMTKLSTRITSQMEDRGALGRAWIKEVKEKCPEVKFIDHYALLGQYDFLDIFEAPDAESAIRQEKRLKNWRRDWKINLINDKNPEWKDLSEDWFSNEGD